MKIQSVEPTVFLTRQPDGALRQRVEMVIENDGEACAAAIHILGLGLGFPSASQFG